MTVDAQAEPSDRPWIPWVRVVTVLAGVMFLAFGLWAFMAPASFFEALATFEPYNAHLLRDIGAFQIGLGAVLVLSAYLPAAKGAAVLGVGVGAAFHAVGHAVDRDLGGSPVTDIPTFAVLAVVLLWAGIVQTRAA